MKSLFLVIWTYAWIYSDTRKQNLFFQQAATGFGWKFTDIWNCTYTYPVHPPKRKKGKKNTPISGKIHPDKIMFHSGYFVWSLSFGSSLVSSDQIMFYNVKVLHLNAKVLHGNAKVLQGNAIFFARQCNTFGNTKEKKILNVPRGAP